MNPTHEKCSLYLHPEQATFNISNLAALTNTLQTIGLISQPINKKNAKHDYFTGNKYLNYIAYLGCAPSIQFAASHDNNAADSINFCHIRIHQHKTAQLIVSRIQPSTPLCPHCKKPATNWQHTKTATTLTCKQCDTSANIEQFNWRRMAGYAQLFVEITDIFPKEAIPQQTLLDELKKITHVNWRYFYRCQ